MGSQMSSFDLIGPANQFGVCGAGAALVQCLSGQTSPAVGSSAQSLSHQLPSEDQPHHPSSGGWHFSTFLELKPWQYGWFNRENCKSSLIEELQEAVVAGG